MSFMNILKQNIPFYGQNFFKWTVSVLWKLWHKATNSLMKNKHPPPPPVVPQNMLFKVDSKSGEFLP